MPSRRPGRQLTQLFDASPLPVYLVDEGRRIVYCNASCSAWLGVPAERLAGQTCCYQSGELASREEQAAASLCPPPPAFLGSQVTAHVVWQSPEGGIERRPASFVPIGVSDGESYSVLVVLGEPQPAPGEAYVRSEDATSQTLHERLQQLARQLRTRFRLDRLVGDSLAMQRVREQVRVAIVSRPGTLIVGPPGSGREHVGRTIHAGDDPGAAGPLTPLECGLLDADLLQATVLTFLRRSQDQWPKAPRTLLLLDVDQLQDAAQHELLGFLRLPTITLRTIATARRPLLMLASQGHFLQELAYRLSALVIELPPLRERREDIPLLAQRFVEEFNATGAKQLAGLSPAALDRLAALPWSGDVGELAAVVVEACRRASTVWIGEADLPHRVRDITSAAAHPRKPAEAIKLDDFLLDVERELVQRAMKRSRGNKAKAARLLGVSRPRLLRRLVQLGLEQRMVPEIEFKPLEEDSPPPEGPGRDPS